MILTMLICHVRNSSYDKGAELFIYFESQFLLKVSIRNANT
jgi:hypothetical protein